MRKARPIITGLDLTEQESSIISYWLDHCGYDRVENCQEALQKGDKAIHLPSASKLDLLQLLDWNLPVLAIIGAQYPAQELEAFFRAGLAALYRIPAPGEPIFFPAFSAMGGQQAHILNPDRTERIVLRTILQMAGFRVRSDFRSTTELLQSSDEPDLLLASLAALQIGEMDRWHRSLEKKPLILLSGNFSASAPDLKQVFYLRRLSRRIFSFSETFYALMEGLFFHNAEPESFHTLRALLLAEKVTLLKKFPEYTRHSLALQRGLMFAWLYELVEEKARGIILNE